MITEAAEYECWLDTDKPEFRRNTHSVLGCGCCPSAAYVARTIVSALRSATATMGRKRGLDYGSQEAVRQLVGRGTKLAVINPV